MKLKLEINNLSQSPVSEDFFKLVGERTFSELNFGFLSETNLVISVALVVPEEMKKINKKYRKHDNITDILSFPEYQNIEEIKTASMNQKTFPEGELFLGELILCYDDIKEYTDKKGIKLEKELAKVVSHGILHLLGFSHGGKMFTFQSGIENYFNQQ
jgi:rRNA maturation RNase YbeY